MQTKIESRSDYELYVRKILKKYLFNLIMKGFDDGVNMCMGRLRVEI